MENMENMTRNKLPLSKRARDMGVLWMTTHGAKSLQEVRNMEQV